MVFDRSSTIRANKFENLTLEYGKKSREIKKSQILMLSFDNFFKQIVKKVSTKL